MLPYKMLHRPISFGEELNLRQRLKLNIYDAGSDCPGPAHSRQTSMVSSISGDDMGSPNGSATGTNKVNRVRRKRKEALPLNILVLGRKNCGKTTLIRFLTQHLSTSLSTQQSCEGEFVATVSEFESCGEKVKLTLWDSLGFADSIIDIDLANVISFLENKFEETYAQENRIIRTPSLSVDTHIHAVLYLFDPVSWLNGQISKSHFEILSEVSKRASVFTAVSKADTCTIRELSLFRRTIKNRLVHISATDEDREDLDLPWSLISPEENADNTALDFTRTYAWGQLDPLNPKHCDFSKLDSLIRELEWRVALRDTSKDAYYERWRTEKLEGLQGGRLSVV